MGSLIISSAFNSDADTLNKILLPLSKLSLGVAVNSIIAAGCRLRAPLQTADQDEFIFSFYFLTKNLADS